MEMTHAETCQGRPIDVLVAEHQIIERGLAALDQVLNEGRIDIPFMQMAIDFFRSFADGCHHAKEEGQLFPMLESAGIKREGGPIGCMLHQHMVGRALVSRIADALARYEMGATAEEVEIQEASREFIKTLRHHIVHEGGMLFWMAEQVLDANRQGALSAEFAQVSQSPKQAGRHEKYSAIADQMHSRAFGNSTQSHQGETMK